MKRFFSSAIAMMLVFAMFAPVTAKAQTDAKVELKQAIQIAKDTFNITDNGYNFNSNYSEYNNKKSWYLSWNSATNGSISVTVDADTGEILNYNFWKPDNGPTSRIPKYTEDEAKKAAIAFVEKIAPEKFKQTEEDENINKYNMNNIYYSPDYNFTFIRLANGIPYRNNQITVSVGKNTLDIHSYYLNWDDIAFPDPKAAISNDDAIKIFKDKLGLKLQYNLVYSQVYEGDTSKPQAILVYGIYNNSPIDALTGEIIDNNNYYGPMYGGAGNPAMGKKSLDINLSPQEQKAIENTEKYITKDKALEIVKNTLPFTIGDEYKLNSANLYSGYPVGTNASWSFYWNYNKDNSYNYISANVDAVTGELKSFYRGGSNIDNVQGKEPIYTKEQMKKTVEDYLNKIQPDKFKQTEYQDKNLQGNKNPNYPFEYMQTANGILCPFNNIVVNVSPYTGEITGYSLNWVSVDLPSSQNVINLDDAYKILFDNSTFGLNYIAKYDYTQDEPQKPEIKLAYQLNGFYDFIDAKTGQIVDYNGKPVVKKSATSFTDISGNWAEKDIKLLVQYGIVDSKEDKFYPDKDILQKDFIKMLIKAIQPPYYDPVPASSQDYDAYYNIAIQKKIIAESERKPDNFVTRQDAAKFLIKSLGIGYIADLHNIFVLSFKDKGKISQDMTGYIAIASGLKLMNGSDGYFNPDGKLTRAEAAAVLVRYLQLEK